MKKLFCLLLALCLMAAPALAEDHSHVDEDGFAVINPMHDVEGAGDVERAVPGIRMPRLPKDVNTVMYSYIDSLPMIGQVQFCWEDHFYTLRAAVLFEGGGLASIDGVYLPFDQFEEFTNLFEGDQDILYVKSSSEEAYALCSWVYDGVQYSLFSETAGEPQMPIIELAAMIMQEQSDWVVNSEE